MEGKTIQPKKATIRPQWIHVDAADKVLGRLASTIAIRLRGKHNPHFAWHVDTGDFVVVTNADKVRLTGTKWDTKIYYRHTGYPGGIKSESARELANRKPTELLRKAVKNMLPKNRLGRQMIKKLKLYAGEAHPHAAQKPITIN